jgi:hypothetical protein
MFLLPRCQSPRPAATPDSTVGPPAVHPHHVRFVAGAVRELAAFCGDLLQRLGRDRLHARQRLLILVNRLATELLTAALVLARSADPAAPEPDLADLYCTAARQRVEDLWRRLRDPASPDHRAVAARVLAQAARPPREGHARQAPS